MMSPRGATQTISLFILCSISIILVQPCDSTSLAGELNNNHDNNKNAIIDDVEAAGNSRPEPDPVPLRRLLRAVGKATPLARRPKTTTTTTPTTSTTTGTSTTTAESVASAGEDDSAPSDDYEDIAKPKQQPKKATTPEPEASEEEQEEEEEAVEGESPTSPQPTSTTTSTTTRRPSVAPKPKLKPKPKGKSSSKSRDSNGQPTRAEVATTIASPKGDARDSGPAESGARGSAEPANSSSGAAPKRKTPLVRLPFIRLKNDSACTPEAYREFPEDLIGDKWRARGLVLVHIAVVCYMFYSLALVCERYFMPSLEEFAQRLNLSEDVAGATLMSAGSSAPELFTAILGVFVAKGDVGTGAIVGSAVFNILFVIGICSFVCTTNAQLNWWPVLRDSVFYTFTVLVLILIIDDERVTAFESFFMLALYGVYILVMAHNETIKLTVTKTLQSYPATAKFLRSATSMDGADDVFAVGSSSQPPNCQTTSLSSTSQQGPTKASAVEDDSMYLAALLVILRHKRLFGSQVRFQSAARYIIVKRQHKVQQQQKSIKCSDEVNYFGPESDPLKPGSSNNQRDKMEAYARGAMASKSKFSIVSKDDYEFWNRPPDENENYYLWLAKIPVNYVLHYTIPDCTLYPDRYLYTFFISITWTALFSYIMVWMVTLIGYTFGVPDSVMGVTFLAAGTSVPDCYSSIHAARNGMADMAVSNSIGSNVFDILIGLSLPWFIQSAIYPGVVATINSRGVIYSVILLFLSLIVTIYLMNKYEWTLKPRLGLALLIAYGLFIVLTCMLEFNLFGHVNPPPC